MSGKREDYISWDAMFMGIASEAAWRSKDPRTQNGACIVTPDHREFSVGYNGFPSIKGKDNDEIFPWIGDGENGATVKYQFVIHSEVNAILNARFPLANSSLYLYSERGYYPCENCAQCILQKEIG